MLPAENINPIDVASRPTVDRRNTTRTAKPRLKKNR